MSREPNTTLKSVGEPPKVAVGFTETMTGHVLLGETDPARGQQRGHAADSTLTFRLTIRTEDVHRFVSEPAHTATATGWVECEALGGRLPVERGEFNLFVADGPHRRMMLYRLWFRDKVGHPLTLRGHKLVGNDRALDLWSDTTTLLTQILIGHIAAVDDASAQVTAAGVLRIRPLNFARQLTTFVATGSSPSARLWGLATFGGFFLGQLWHVYGVRLPGLPGAQR